MGHVVITGASSGLGEYLAIELGRRGYSLGLIARRKEQLEQVAEKVRATGAKAAVAAADVTDREAVHAAIRGLEAEFGPTGIVIANAGTGIVTSGARFNAQKIGDLMRLNFDGVMYAFEAVLPAMMERKSGQIVAVSSLAGYRGLPGNGAYGASKAAVTTMMQALSTELRPQGIIVTTIHPGFVRTPLTDKNRFKMPFLMEPERAAQIMADGIEGKRRTINFPWQMGILMRALQAVPAPIFEALAGKVAPPPDKIKGP